MSDTTPPGPFLQDPVRTEILLVPTDDEKHDFETISMIGDVTDDVLRETNAIEGYRSKIMSHQHRDAGVILLLHEIAHQVIAQKDLIIAFLQAGVAAIGVLAKHRHVKKIEVCLDGDSISIDDPDTVTEQRLLDLFQARHADIATKVTPASTLQVTGTVSKTGKPTKKR